MPPKTVHIAVVDDHNLFRKGLINLILSFDARYAISIETDRGETLLQRMANEPLPDLLIMDMNMPQMDGAELTAILRERYPELKILVVSMISKEETIIRMLRLGIKGYLSKDINPDELHHAIESILNKGFYYTDFITGKLLDAMHKTQSPFHETNHSLNDRELQFLQLACSDDTYQQIADKMFLSIKTIDGYRASLFEKLNVKSRSGLVLYGIKSGLVPL